MLRDRCNTRYRCSICSCKQKSDNESGWILGGGSHHRYVKVCPSCKEFLNKETGENGLFEKDSSYDDSWVALAKALRAPLIKR